MNYRGRVMELDLGWSGAELRCMAAEMAAEADQEIARLETDLELARRDAGRYQWLRKYHFGSPYIVDFHGCAIRGDDADSDIDAARAANGGEG